VFNESCTSITLKSDGRLLFEQIVAMDLEGIVCKNSQYSQLEGREELF